MRNAIRFCFSLLYEKRRRGFSAPLMKKQQVRISVHKLRCANIQLKFLFQAPLCWKDTIWWIHWWIAFPVGLALPCGTSLEFLSEFQGQASFCRAPLRCPLFWSLRSPLCLPLLILNCKSSSCLSANVWASLGYTRNSPLLPCTLFSSNPARLYWIPFLDMPHSRSPGGLPPPLHGSI